MSVRIYSPQDGNQKLSFDYGDERISFERLARTEGIHRLLIKVHPDCRVQVAAPEGVAENDILAAVKKRGRWIYQQLRDFREQQKHVSPRKYVSGESHYYLGKQYLLKVTEVAGLPDSVTLTRGKLEVSLKNKSAERVSALLAEWYRQEAKDVFAKRLDAMLEQTLWIKDRPPVRILRMKTQWGSCSPAGRLTLNPHLVKAPRECIDYVILHELCHIAEHNHSKRFYRLMTQVMPGWEDIKSRLDGMVEKILN